MSRTPATGQRALDVPATPATPLVDASLQRTPEVLTQAPLRTEKKPKDRLALIDDYAGSLDLVRQYFVQVYHWKATDVVEVSSWDAAEAELAKCSSIGELVILSHAVYSAVSVHGVQLTPNQFADRFAPVAPPISALSFDGCVIGQDLSGLHAIATRMKISQVRGWTFWHYMDWWRMTPTGDPAGALAQFQPLAQRASPYLPKSLLGDVTYSAAEQEPLFSSSKLNLAGEYFVESILSMVKPDFVQAIIANQIDPAIHRTRSSAEIRLIDSGAAQSALETALSTSRPVFARAVVTPWV